MKLITIMLTGIFIFVSGCTTKPVTTKVISPQYLDISYIGDNRFIAQDEYENYKIINGDNNVISDSFQKLSNIYDSSYEYIIEKDSEISLFIAQKDGKYGIINANGEIVVPFLYEYITCTGDIAKLYGEKTEYFDFITKKYLPFEDLKTGRDGKYIIEKNGECSVVDKNGNVILNSNRTIADVTGETVIIAKEEQKHQATDNANIVNSDELLFGIENFDGEKIYDYTNSSIFPVSDGYICQNGTDELLSGFIDFKGNEILPFKYVSVNKIGDLTVAYSDLNTSDFKNPYKRGGITYIDKEKRTITPKDGYYFVDVNGFPCLKRENAVTLFKNDKEITFNDIDEICSVGNKYTTVMHNGIKYITDGKKQYIFKEYEDFYTVENYLLFKKNGLWGISYMGDLS